MTKTIEIVLPRHIETITIIIKKAPQIICQTKRNNKTRHKQTTRKISNAKAILHRGMKTSGVSPPKPFTKRWLELQRVRMEKTCTSTQQDDDDNDHDSDSTYVYESESDSDTSMVQYSTKKVTNVYKQDTTMTSKATFVQEVPPYKGTVIRTITVARSMAVDVKPISTAQSTTGKH